MKFTVVWAKKADDHLLQGWIEADSSLRAEITSACRKLEADLKTAPDELGEARLPGRRIAIEPPLTVLFKLSVDDRLVTVLDVHVRLPRK